MNDATVLSLYAISTANKLMRRNGPDAAIAALEAHLRTVRELESLATLRVYLRLAALYRMCDRFADEVQLLERLIEMNPDDQQRARIDARLSKVHARIEGRRKAPPIPMHLVLPVRRRRTLLERRIARRDQTMPRSSLSGLENVG